MSHIRHNTPPRKDLVFSYLDRNRNEVGNTGLKINTFKYAKINFEPT